MPNSYPGNRVAIRFHVNLRLRAARVNVHVIMVMKRPWPAPAAGVDRVVPACAYAVPVHVPQKLCLSYVINTKKLRREL